MKGSRNISEAAKSYAGMKLNAPRCELAMEILFQMAGPTIGRALLIVGAVAGLGSACVLVRMLVRRNRQGVQAASLALAGAALTLPLSFFCIVHSSPFNARLFDPRGWAANNFKGECRRGQMAGDLLRFHLKDGASRERVLALLGQPGSNEKLSDGTEIYRYSLGSCSGFRIDTDYLDVHLDRSGTVLQARVWQS